MANTAPKQPEPPQEPSKAPEQPKPPETVDIFSETETVSKEADPQAKPGESQAPPTVQQTILTPKEQDELFKREKLSTIQKVILIAIAFVVIAGLIGGGIWLYFTLSKNTENPPEEEVIEDAIIVNTPVVVPENVPVEIDTTIDIDKDGLTLEQEIKYGTNPDLADTDNDGYLDGEEVEGGFNPLGPGEL